MQPNDAGLLVAEGDALVQTGRPGEAIGVYRNALRRAAEPDVVNPRVAAAQSQRQALLNACLTRDGSAAEHACASAWLPGAPDEVAIFKRRGLLLQSAGQSAAALDAYLAAARLRPADRNTARAIVSLSERVGRKDVPTLMAFGTALTTLGHRTEAAAAFREVLQLDPTFAPAKERLRLAERSTVPAPGETPQEADATVASADSAPVIVNYSNAAQVTRSN